MSIEQIIARQEEIIEKGVTKFSHYMDWFDEFQKQGHYRMDDNDIREILSSSIKEILEGIKQIEAGKNIEGKLPFNRKLCQNQNLLDYCGTCEQAWEDCSCSARNTGWSRAKSDTINYIEEIIKKL